MEVQKLLKLYGGIMEAKDLRIGNFVTWVDEDNPFNAILTISGITLGIGLFVEWEFSDGINDNTDCDFGNVKPIPLTKEWLLNFGFHLDEGVGVWFGKELSPAKYFTIWQACGDVPHKYTRNEPSDNININYVHQLQNLYFALTGEELNLHNGSR